MNNILLTVSILFSLIAPIVGIIGILQGNFRPQRMTRFIFLVITLTSFGSLLLQGDRTAVYLAGVEFLASITIFILSIKYGMGGFSKFDLTVLALSSVAFIIWQSSQNHELGLIMAIITDIIAFSPSIIKMIKEPATEDAKFYLFSFLAALFSLLSMSDFTFMGIIFPLYILIINGLSVFLIKLMPKLEIRNYCMSVF